MFNQVTFIGRTVKDLELKTTGSGTNYVQFNLAVKRTFTNTQGEYESDFVPCKAFKTQADILHKYVKKGDLVGIGGEFRSGTYENSEGKTIYTHEIIVNKVVLLTSKKDKSNEPDINDFYNMSDNLVQDDDLPF